MSILDTKHKKKSFTLTTILLSVLLFLLFYIGLTYMDPPEERGISVNFGTTNFGSGKVKPVYKIKSEPVNKPVEQNTAQEEIQEEVEEVNKEKVLTRESEEAILMKQQKEKEQKADIAIKKVKVEADRIAREKQEAINKKLREEAVKKSELDAMMSGLNKSDETASGSEGNDTNKIGDKGQSDGDPYATSYYGSSGYGNSNSGYGLNGRSLVKGGKVKQDCNEEGRVVVKVVVDKNGNVISAVAGVRGTTNSHPCLIAPAKKTAFMHRWNLDSNAPKRQIGFVVVNFKLVE